MELFMEELAKDLGISVEQLGKKIAICKLIQEAYKSLNCKGCGVGCLTKSQGQERAACLTAEVGLRSRYLQMKFDYVLLGSITRGSATAEKGHQIQLAEKLAALAKCTTKAVP